MGLPKTLRSHLVPLLVSIVGLLILSALITPLVLGETPFYAPPPTMDITRLPPAKRTMESRIQVSQATALAGPKPPQLFNTPATWATPVPTVLDNNIQRRPAGAGTIVETGLAPFPAMAYIFENQWYAPVGNEYVNIWAGAVGDDPTQGVVVIAHIALPGSKITPQPGAEYKTPTKAGSVHIVDADGMRLKLVAENGASFTFDVTSGKFVSP